MSCNITFYNHSNRLKGPTRRLKIRRPFQRSSVLDEVCICYPYVIHSHLTNNHHQHRITTSWCSQPPCSCQARECSSTPLLVRKHGWHPSQPRQPASQPPCSCQARECNSIGPAAGPETWVTSQRTCTRMQASNQLLKGSAAEAVACK